VLSLGPAAVYLGLDGRRADAPLLHHLALEIDKVDHEAEKARLQGLDVRVTTAEHAWVRWRSLYVDDPEGNTVEWVCYDESVGSKGSGS
jgi:catechol-2,3-dioxygenase